MRPPGSRRSTVAAIAGWVVTGLVLPAQSAGPTNNPFANVSDFANREVFTASASLGQPTTSPIRATLTPPGSDGPPVDQFAPFIPASSHRRVSIGRAVEVAAPPPQPQRLPLPTTQPPPANTPPAATLPPATTSPVATSPVAAAYLPTRTVQNRLAAAAERLETARVDLDAGAYASAEALCWEALALAAEAVDLQNGDRAASDSTVAAKTAIGEATDFVGPYCDRTPAAVARIARSHRTDVVRGAFPVGSPPRPGDVPEVAVAIDRYLDFARGHLAAVASRSVAAAQAIDLIAAVRLARGDQQQMPAAVSLCLRRAAVQGQGGNADLVAKLGMQLAEGGFEREARWALGRSLQIQPNEHVAAAMVALDAGRRPTPAVDPVHRRVPEITPVTPDQFAATSRPPAGVSPTAPTVQPAGYRETAPPPPAPTASVGRRVLSAIRWW